MAESGFNYLINLIFQAIGVKEATTEVNQAEEAMKGFTQTSQATVQKIGAMSGAVKVQTTTWKDMKGNLMQVQEGFDAFGNSVGKTIKTIDDTSKRAAKGGMSDFINAMRRAVIVAPIWMAMRLVLTSVFNLIRDQARFITETETAMARFGIIGKGTADQLQGLKIALIDVATHYGITSQEAFKAASAFLMEGKTLSQAVLLTKAAAQASILLGSDMETTTANIIDAVEGFNIPFTESIGIIDKWITIQKSTGVAAKELAEAIKAAGTTANQLGVSINSFLGDVTAIADITGKSGQAAGNALQLIYTRLLTTGRKAVQDIAKVPVFLNEQGQATTNLTGRYRNLTDILDDLAGHWESLTKEERLSVAVNVGSRRQIQTFLALMQNYSTSLDARITATTSAGATDREFIKIQDTLAVKMKEVGASWNQLADSLGNTGPMKAAVSGLKSFLDVMTNILDSEKSDRLALEEIRAAKQKEIQVQQTQLSSLAELVSLRDKFLAKPPSDKNVEALKKINTAIIGMVDAFPDLKQAFKDSDVNAIKDKIGTMKEDLQRSSIVFDVLIDTDKAKTQLLLQKAALEKRLTIREPFITREELGIIENQLRGVNILLEKFEADRNVEIDKRMAKLKVEENMKRLIAESSNEELGAEAKLTDADIEKIQNEGILNSLKAQGVLTDRQLLEVELDLVRNSSSLYEARDKSKKILELELQIQSARVREATDIVNKEVEILRLRGLSGSQLLEAETALKEMVVGEDAIRTSVAYQTEQQKVLTQEALKMIDHELELARIRGASGLELVKAKENLMAQAFGEDAVSKNLELRLEKEKELTRELTNQNKLSSESITLYKVASRFGNDIATSFARVLQGQKEIASLSTREQGIFQKFFGSEAEQLKAQKFFTSGGGAGIPIRELQTNVRPVNIPGLIPGGVATSVAKVQQAISVDIKPININVNIETDQIIQKVKDSIIDELDNSKSLLSQKINEKIEDF